LQGGDYSWRWRLFLPSLEGRGSGWGAAEALGGSIHNRLKYTLGVFVQLVVPDTDDRPTFPAQELVTPPIMIRFGMLAAVELDDQLRLAAREVGEIGADR